MRWPELLQLQVDSQDCAWEIQELENWADQCCVPSDLLKHKDLQYITKKKDQHSVVEPAHPLRTAVRSNLWGSSPISVLEEGKQYPKQKIVLSG